MGRKVACPCYLQSHGVPPWDLTITIYGVLIRQNSFEAILCRSSCVGCKKYKFDESREIEEYHNDVHKTHDMSITISCIRFL